MILGILFINAFAGFDVTKVTVLDNEKEVTVHRQSVQNCDYATAPQFVWAHQGVKPECLQSVATFAGKIQPIQIVRGVQTVGELEVLEFMQNLSSDKMLIDARGEHWLASGTIAGSINISHDSLEYLELLHESYVATMAKLGVQTDGKTHTFENAKELIVFCNGAWCPQSGWFIKNLIKIGYPKSKLKWYRGGMSSWKSLGLSVLK
jgi:rhodanese-related sulfurtransferase